MNQPDDFGRADTSQEAAVGGTAPDREPPSDGTQIQQEAPTHLFDLALPQVSGYTVTREIARGGMGVVYAARLVAEKGAWRANEETEQLRRELKKPQFSAPVAP